MLEAEFILVRPPNSHVGVETLQADTAVAENGSRAAEDRSAAAADDWPSAGDSETPNKPLHKPLHHSG
jgi:hypothetical protein